jgi:TonB-dependent receptor
VRWGAFASSVLELSKAHKLTLVGMRSQLADARTNVFDGFNANTMASIAGTRMEFVSRALSLGQLQGTHELPALNDAVLDWRVSLALAERDEPDTRDVVFQRNELDSPWSYLDGTESGRHFFSGQNEDSKTVGFDWTQPLTKGDVATKLKAGTLVTLKDREFRARRFAFRHRSRGEQQGFVCGDRYDPIACPRDVFVDEAIGPSLRLEEGTRPGDAYDASLHIYAGYLMGELALGESWRFLGGARIEATEQTIGPFDPFSGMADESQSNRLVNQDVLPSASIVYSPIEDFNIRAAVTRTLARPQLRELAPFAFSDYFGGAQQSGNPDLVLTGILNADLRFEYFPTPREVLALSVFAKDFTDPIEPVLVPASTTNVLTYRNAQGALLYGAELEARKTLDFVAESLEDFTLIASLMLADSNIRVTQTGDDFLTNTERPLVHAAPYVVNAAIDYEDENRTQVRVLYNVSGPRLVEVGTNGLDDAYAHPVHQVDVSASQGLGEHFRLRLTIQNLLDAEVLVTQGRDDKGYNLVSRFKEGVSASIGLAYTH